MTNEEIYKASLIAGLKLFGYRPSKYNNVKEYAKKWGINLKKYPQKCLSGLIWTIYKKDFSINKEKLTKRAFELMTEAVQDDTDFAFETVGCEYIFNPKTGKGFLGFYFDPRIKKEFMVGNKLYAYVAESDCVYETEFDVHSVKEFKKTKTYKEILKHNKEWEEENRKWEEEHNVNTKN